MLKVLLVALLAAALIVPGAVSTCDVQSLDSQLEVLVELSLSVQQGSSVNVTLNGYQIVCLTTGMTRGTYSSASVVVNCTGADCPAGGGKDLS